MNEKAIEFVKPFIESNNYWCSILMWLIAISFLIVISIAVVFYINRTTYFPSEDIFHVLLVISTFICVISSLLFVCLKVENRNLKKFPMVTYNKKVRFFEERRE